MDAAFRAALVEYGRTIKAHGHRAGEVLVEEHERRHKDFRKVARALAMMLRTKELLNEDGRVPK